MEAHSTALDLVLDLDLDLDLDLELHLNLDLALHVNLNPDLYPELDLHLDLRFFCGRGGGCLRSRWGGWGRGGKGVQLWHATQNL